MKIPEVSLSLHTLACAHTYTHTYLCTHEHTCTYISQREARSTTVNLAGTHDPALPLQTWKELHPIRTCHCATGNTASLPSSIQGDLLRYDRSGSQPVPPVAQSSSLIVAMPSPALPEASPGLGSSSWTCWHCSLALTTSSSPSAVPVARLPVCVLDVLSTFYVHTWQSLSSNAQGFPCVQVH